MNTIVINILCEGQTEERFVKSVLKKHLRAIGLVVKCRLLRAKGGMIGYEQVKRDLACWVKENSWRKGERHYYTTMFDFYALPKDFPGYTSADQKQDPYLQVETLENAFAQDLCIPNFIPYIQLHEFEALLFCGIESICEIYPRNRKSICSLENVLSKEYQGNPELIDSGASTAPSKRIVAAVEAERRYRYNKPLSAEQVTAKTGIVKLKRMCRHFREWLERIESIVS